MMENIWYSLAIPPTGDKFLFVHFCKYGLHKALLKRRPPPKVLEKKFCHSWVRRCRWSWVFNAGGAMAAPPYMLRLPVRQHLAKAGWPVKAVRDDWRQSHMGKWHGIYNIYFKIFSNVPTHCEKTLVQYQKYVLCFRLLWLQTSPCFSLQKCHGVPSSVRHLLPASLVAQAAQALC